jgi:hypothetical protein
MQRPRHWEHLQLIAGTFTRRSEARTAYMGIKKSKHCDHCYGDIARINWNLVVCVHQMYCTEEGFLMNEVKVRIRGSIGKPRGAVSEHRLELAFRNSLAV